MPGLTLHDLMLLPIARLRRFFDALVPDSSLLDEALKLLLDEIRTRLKYLCDVGLGYLTLDRQSRTLSGGEVQRINLTTALGTSLVNTLFVLDEPSIGLHPRDMGRIIEAMQRLRDAGNTLVVVEHDPAVMLAADRLIDMGPGPGAMGGRIVFDGTPDDARRADTLTGAYLGARKHVGIGIRRYVSDATPKLVLEGAREHNLKNLDVSFPLQRLTVVTGVSGSGKSTLVQDVLVPALLRHFGKATESPGEHDRLLGADWLADAIFVDQSPIGKTARSNPASYVGAFDEMRKLFADAPLAIERRYGAGMFSFNAGDGRCATCGGSGFEHVEMQFLSDVYLRCPDCDGRRYRAEILEVRIVRGARQLSVADVLDLTVAEACELFRDDREVIARLQPIVDVGLDYVRLGQPVPTLSGGEAQRLKLAGFLAEAAGAPRQPRGQEGHAVPVRRADHRPALRRHRQADARAAQAARRRPLADRDRAQPRRDPQRRLGDRPRPRRRRRRRRGGGHRHAGGPEGAWHARTPGARCASTSRRSAWASTSRARACRCRCWCARSATRRVPATT